MQVTYEEMHTTAQKLTQGHDDINTRLTQLQNDIATLVAEGFKTDQAGPAYHDAYNNFTTGASQTIDGLHGLADYLNKAADALQQADSDLASGIKQ